jgi:hypothetical protein
MLKLMAKRGRKPKHPASHDAETGRSGKPFTMRLDPEILEVLDKYILRQRFRTSRTDVIEVALQEMFKAEGWWPPGSEPSIEE